MVGDENPPACNNHNRLAGLETKTNVEQNQRFAFCRVSRFQAASIAQPGMSGRASEA